MGQMGLTKPWPNPFKLANLNVYVIYSNNINNNNI